MAIDELVCSCDPQALDGSSDIVAAHQQAKVQELPRYMQHTDDSGGFSKQPRWLTAWVAGGCEVDSACRQRPNQAQIGTRLASECTNGTLPKGENAIMQTT